MSVVTLVDIPTDEWAKIVFWLRTNGWSIRYKYNEFDAGIDYDLIVFERDGSEIRLGWTNWEEGEIQCDSSFINAITTINGHGYKTGLPSSLRLGVVSIFYKSV
jgi:hypothetical protein